MMHFPTEPESARCSYAILHIRTGLWLGERGQLVHEAQRWTSPFMTIALGTAMDAGLNPDEFSVEPVI